MTDWAFQRNARKILFKVKNDEMHLHDALARLEQLHEAGDRGRYYGKRESA